MRKIIKKIGGDRIGSGGKMTVAAHGYGYSTHDVGKVTRTSMSFGTIVPVGMWFMTAGSRLSGNLDALITSNALLYQLYGSAKFQIDVFSARVALYNPKMLLNLNDQGYDIEDIKFPQKVITAFGLENEKVAGLPIDRRQVNPSSLQAMLGITAVGQRTNQQLDVVRQFNAMWDLMYYHTGKEYYCNRQEGIGMMIHNEGIARNVLVAAVRNEAGSEFTIDGYGNSGGSITLFANSVIQINYTDALTNAEAVVKQQDLTVKINQAGTEKELLLSEMSDGVGPGTNIYQWVYLLKDEYIGANIVSMDYAEVTDGSPKLREWDLKAVDRMSMALMKSVDSGEAFVIDEARELPYSASLKGNAEFKSINTTQEGLILGTYQSDVFNNYLDNATINALNNKSKVKVDENGEFSIDQLNLTQKLYNYDQRIGITDGTLEEWRELTYAQVGKSKSLKPVYEGGLSKEIVFDMVVSTAGTESEPLGSIASRGQFSSKHKGGYIQIDTDEEKLVMVLCKITPRLVYNQGIDWTNNLKTLDDLHKPALDKIGYQNLLSDQSAAVETVVNDNGTLITKSIGKQPAWQWYRTAYDTALGNMAYEESYKVFGREYSYIKQEGVYIVQDQTTYINPMKFNDVFAIESLDAMNFDVQVGMDFKMTLVMSEELIPNL